MAVADSAPIRPGTSVIITDATGKEHEAIAASSPKRGRDFVVVEVRLTTRGEAIPWPAESVRASEDEEDNGPRFGIPAKYLARKDAP